MRWNQEKQGNCRVEQGMGCQMEGKQYQDLEGYVSTLRNCKGGNQHSLTSRTKRDVVCLMQK